MKQAALAISVIVCVSLLASGCLNGGNTVSGKPAAGASVKEFTVTARQFAFEPPVIEVNKGDFVRLKAKSVDVTHGIAIPEFGVDVILPPGQEKLVEFTAAKSGSYTFYCSVFCGQGHSRMSGTIVVKDN